MGNYIGSLSTLTKKNSEVLISRMVLHEFNIVKYICETLTTGCQSKAKGFLIDKLGDIANKSKNE